jgi:DNA-binding CsgD family transcriptional regulator
MASRQGRDESPIEAATGARRATDKLGITAAGRRLPIVKLGAPPPDLKAFTDIMEQFLHISGSAFVKILELSRRSLLVELSAQQAPAEIADIRVSALRLLLDAYAPPSVLIDARYDCLCTFGRVERYLRIDPGQMRPNLFAIAQEWLQPKLKAALARASLEICETNLLAEPRTDEDGRFGSCSIAVLPFQTNNGDRLFLLSLLETKARVEQECVGRTQSRIISRPKNGRAIAISTNPMRPPDEAAAEDIAGLSPRQRAVLDLVAEGRSNKQIAGVLGISQRTVESHRALMMRKLGARTFADVMRLFSAST